jgi:hypothetical protein
MAEVKLIIDGAKVAELLRGPAGPIWKHLDRRADAFVPKAQADAPIRTGCLRSGIHKRAIEEVPNGLSIRIVSLTTTCSPDRIEYAFWMHEGTEPHVITPKKPGGVLAFKVDGKTVFARKVNHPGTRAYKYLSRNLYIFDAK